MKSRHVVIGALATIAAMSSANAHVVCTAVADAGTGKVLIEQGDCKRRVTPASTFKIAISLMGYDSGFLIDEHHPVLPYREAYIDWGKDARHAADPARWMRDSVVWFSQQVTQSLGKERLADYSKKFQFGNADVSGDSTHDGLTLSWINSSLQISPLEQLSFLNKVVNRQLRVSQRAYEKTFEITKITGSHEGWDIHGKTGSSGSSGGGWGWFVGWTSKGNRTYSFARLIQDDGSRPNTVGAGLRARDAFVKELPALMDALIQ
jgi:beta-lactamase class D/beta-lactamase class D OXA-42